MLVTFLPAISFSPKMILDSEAFRKPITQKIFLNGSSWRYNIFTSKHKDILWIQTISLYFKKDEKIKPTKNPLYWRINSNKNLNVDKI